MATPPAQPAPPRRVSPWNPANMVTASRYLTLPPFLWAVAHEYRQLATLLVLACGAIDLFDGAVARAFRCQSAFGELFDALTDATCHGFALVVLAAYGWAPRDAVAIILALGVTNIAMRMIYIRRAGRTTNYRSFAMERLVAYAAYLSAFGAAQYETAYFYWSFTGLLAVVVIHDAKRLLIDPIAEPAAPVASQVLPPD